MQRDSQREGRCIQIEQHCWRRRFFFSPLNRRRLDVLHPLSAATLAMAHATCGNQTPVRKHAFSGHIDQSNPARSCWLAEPQAGELVLLQCRATNTDIHAPFSAAAPFAQPSRIRVSHHAAVFFRVRQRRIRFATLLHDLLLASSSRASAAL